MIVADGVGLAVHRSGGGAASLWLHGFAGSGAEILPMAERLDGTRIVPDLVGHGGSESPSNPDRYDMNAIVGQLTAVLDATEAVPVDVVGYSMGARIALALAAASPQRVRSVVAIGGRAGIVDPESRAARRRADDDLAHDIEANGAVWFADMWLRQPLYDTQRRLGEAHMAQVRAARLAVDAVGIANALRGAGSGAQPVVLDVLASADVPILLLVGELDPRFTEAADQIVGAVPTAARVTIRGAGHATHVEAPGATAEAISRLWAAVR